MVMDVRALWLVGAGRRAAGLARWRPLLQIDVIPIAANDATPNLVNTFSFRRLLVRIEKFLLADRAVRTVPLPITTIQALVPHLTVAMTIARQLIQQLLDLRSQRIYALHNRVVWELTRRKSRSLRKFGRLTVKRWSGRASRAHLLRLVRCRNAHPKKDKSQPGSGTPHSLSHSIPSSVHLLETPQWQARGRSSDRAPELGSGGNLHDV